MAPSQSTRPIWATGLALCAFLLGQLRPADGITPSPRRNAASRRGLRDAGAAQDRGLNESYYNPQAGGYANPTPYNGGPAPYNNGHQGAGYGPPTHSGNGPPTAAHPGGPPLSTAHNNNGGNGGFGNHNPIYNNHDGFYSTSGYPGGLAGYSNLGPGLIPPGHRPPAQTHWPGQGYPQHQQGPPQHNYPQPSVPHGGGLGPPQHGSGYHDPNNHGYGGFGSPRPPFPHMIPSPGTLAGFRPPGTDVVMVQPVGPNAQHNMLDYKLMKKQEKERKKAQKKFEKQFHKKDTKKRKKTKRRKSSKSSKSSSSSSSSSD